MSRFDQFAEVTPGSAAAGFAYPHWSPVTSTLLFWRTLPWDHAPGALIAQEAGCAVHRLDGSPYRADQDDHGLIWRPGRSAGRPCEPGFWMTHTVRR